MRSDHRPRTLLIALLLFVTRAGTEDGTVSAREESPRSEATRIELDPGVQERLLARLSALAAGLTPVGSGGGT